MHANKQNPASSPSRVEPDCVHFGRCGGCQLQETPYPSQLLGKQERLASLLAGVGLANLPPIETEFSEAYAYRNRIRLRIEPDAAGRVRAGYSLRSSHEFLPIAMCPIAAPALWLAVEAILQMAETDALTRRWLAIACELELFTSPDEASVQLHFFLRNADSAKRASSTFAGFCTLLGEKLATLDVGSRAMQLIGATASLDPELDRRSRRVWPGTAWGAAGLSYAAAGRDYWVPRGAFFQVNRFLVDRLVSLVAGDRTGPLAWDLYAGVGLFTRALAERFARVVAVEGAPAAAAALATLKAPVTALHSSTLDFLRARVLDRERPSLIVLDPPRAGLGAEASQLLARIGPPEIVYVSCDPATLALDLAHLANYEIASVTLIDLFPQTSHIESVTHLRKRSAGNS